MEDGLSFRITLRIVGGARFRATRWGDLCAKAEAFDGVGLRQAKPSLEESVTVDIIGDGRTE